MNSQIVKTFNDVNFEITKEGEEIWWWGKDVTDILGYAESSKAISTHVDDYGKRKVQKPVSTFGSLVSNYKSMAWQVNEFGLYGLIFGSKMPNAKDFRKWVFTEVLPSIRKTGEYKKPALKHNQLSLISEKDLHYEVVKEIRKRWPGLLLVVQMGELQDKSWKRLDAWKKGFKGGQPDLMIMNTHRHWNGLAIEFKNPGGTGVLSEKQKTALEEYEGEGWKTMVCDDLISCLFEIQTYNEDIVKVCRRCKKMFKTDVNLERHMEKFH